MNALDRIAGAPITWGVCEVPGWGYQLPPERVLADMHDIGLSATELGPDGFLPTDPDEMARVLAEHHLVAVGGFTPLVLHDPAHDPIPEARRGLAGFVAAKAHTMVVAAATGREGYDARPVLDEDGWRTLFGNLDRVAAVAAEHDVRAVLHAHVGTMIETGPEVQRVLEASSIPLCLDTGHLLIGGTDPAELTRQAADRIAHTHLKDVDDRVAARVRAGELTYTDGVRAGMYRPLGQGDIDIAGIVGCLEGHAYDGWYTLEQDTILTAEPVGDGPEVAARASVEYLRNVLTG
jgi:inosose dehydratase